MELVQEKYKQTEIGLISSDWKVKSLGECLIKNPDYGINAASVKYNDTLPTYLRITDISESGKYISQSKVSVNHSLSSLYFLDEEDIVFARTGASVGKTYLYKKGDGKLVFAGFLIRAKVNPKILNHQYLYYLTQTKYYWSWVLTNSMRSGQPGINSNEIKLLPIPLPPTLQEQTIIATAISNADTWITNLENLLTKKRQIKQGALQELLKPKKGWEVKKLGEVGECIIGLTYSPDNVTTEGKLVLRSSNVKDNKLVYSDTVFVNVEVSEKLITRKGDILICVRNGSRNLIGKCAYIDGRGVGETFGAFMSVFRSNYNAYIFQVFQSNIIKKQIEEHLGATINQITNKSLNSFQIPFPTIKEQEFIVDVLSDMDAEIEHLETKLEKAKKVKQGMMQELLTGKIRLV